MNFKEFEETLRELTEQGVINKTMAGFARTEGVWCTSEEQLKQIITKVKSLKQ